MNWFYAVDQQQLGPISQVEFNRLVGDGTIKTDTMVWREGMANWQSYGEYAASHSTPRAATPPNSPFAPVPVSEDTAVCAVSGKIYPKREMIQYEGKWISAEHRDAYFQRMREGVVQPGSMQYCGFWIRVGARIIDGVAFFIIAMIFGVVISLFAGGAMKFNPNDPRMQGPAVALILLLELVMFGVFFFYNWYFVAKFQGTPGKLALGMKIVRADGSRLSNGRIIGRFFADMINGFIFSLPYIMVGVDKDQHRGLHDHICDTRVVKR